MSGPLSKALDAFRAQTLPAEAVIQVSDLLHDAMAMQAKRTQKAYGGDLRAFARFVGAENADDAIRRLIASSSTVANSVVLAYQADMKRAGLARATINRRIAALRSVVKLASAADLTNIRLDLVRTMKVEERSRDVRGPGLVVIRWLLEVCDSDPSVRGVRDAAMIRWFLVLGLRRNEMRTLRIADLRLDDDKPRIWVEQKGFETRQPVAVGPGAIGKIAPWLGTRGEAPGALFCSLARSSRSMGMLGAQGINKILLYRAECAGFEGGRLPDGRKLTPHAIRHTAITVVAEQDGLLAAQAFARHQNPQTTQRYIDDKGKLEVSAQEYLDGQI